VKAKILEIVATFSAIAQIIENHGGCLHRVELLTDLARYLDVLDMAARDYSHQVLLFHRRRAELELGHLTRDPLTPDQLTEIINTTRYCQ